MKRLADPILIVGVIVSTLIATAMVFNGHDDVSTLIVFLLGTIISLALDILNGVKSREEQFSKMTAFFSALGEKDAIAQIALAYGLREYGEVVSDKKITVDQNHVLQLWRDCIGASKVWLALTYVNPEETWKRPEWEGAVSQGIQHERILAGSTIKRVFIVEDEDEHQSLKAVMKSQEEIHIEVRWITKDELLAQRRTKIRLDEIGTKDVSVVDNTWLFKVYLDKERRMTHAELVQNRDIAERVASEIFNAAFIRGKKP